MARRGDGPLQQARVRGARIEAGIDQNLVPGRNHFAAFRKSKRKPRGKLETPFFLCAAPGEIRADGHGSLPRTLSGAARFSR